MRTTTCFATIALATALILMSAPLRADISTSRPFAPSDTSLQDIFNVVSSPPINAIDDQFNKAVFTNGGSGSAVFAFVAKATGPSKIIQFGIYNFADPSTRAVIFDSTVGTTNGFADMATVSFSEAGDVRVVNASGETITPGFQSHKFGFFIDVLDENDTVLATLYSEDSRNGGDARALIFQGDDATSLTVPGGVAGTFTDAEFVIAFDDGREDAATGTRLDDFADLVVIAQSIVPIPEPGSFVLVACCLVTLLSVPIRRRGLRR